MRHQQLKLELSALLLSEGDNQEPLHYKNKLKEIFNNEYSNEEIIKAYEEIMVLVDKIILAKHSEEIVIFPDQHFEGN